MYDQDSDTLFVRELILDDSVNNDPSTSIT